MHDGTDIKVTDWIIKQPLVWLITSESNEQLSLLLPPSQLSTTHALYILLAHPF